MNENVDVYVCEPEGGINQKREAIFIQFEVMNGESPGAFCRGVVTGVGLPWFKARSIPTCACISSP